MLENQLKQLGFSKNETKVYLALFDIGKCKAGQIIENTGLHRNLVYTALEKLVNKGLVAKVLKNGVATFFVNSPELLLSMVEEQKNIAQEIVDTLKKKNEVVHDIVVYEGDEGIKRSRNRALQYDAGETLYVIGSQASSTVEMEKYWRQFHIKREKQGINFKMMYESGVNPSDLEWRNTLKLSEAKYLPVQIDFPVWFAFIKDYLEIGIPGNNPLTFGLRSKEAVAAFKQFFNYFWNQEVIVENGFESFEKSIYVMLFELKSEEEYFVLGASVGQGDERIQKILEKFHADRIKKGVVVNMLAYKDDFKRMTDRFIRSGDPDLKLSHAKEFISAPPIPMQINIYKGKVFFIIYGEEPTTISFKRPEIAQVFKNYFDSQWNQETQMLKGREVLKDLWLEGVDCKEMKWIGARGYFMDAYPKLFKEIEAKARKTSGVIWKNVVDVSMKEHTLTRLPWMKTRYNLPRTKNPIVIWLFGGKVLIVNWAEGEPIIFCSTNKVLVQSYSDYFDELWERDK